MNNSPKSLFRGNGKLVSGTYASGAGQVPSSAGSLIPHSVSTAGPTFGTVTLGAPVATGNATVHQPFTVALSDFIAGKNPAWFAGLKFYKRAHGDTHLVPVGILLPQSNSVTWTNAVDLGVGATYWDIGFSYIAPNGSESALTYPSALSNINPGALGIGAVGAHAVGWKQLVGDTSADTTTAIADTSNKRLLHAGMSTGVQATIDSSGNIKTSGTFNSLVPNSLANLVSNVVMNSSSSVSGQLSVWFTSAIPSSNPGGTQYPSWLYPNGASGIFPGYINGASTVCGTSGSPWKSWTGLGSGGIYVGVQYDVATDLFTLAYGPTSTQPTDAQVQSALADGNLLVTIALATTANVVPTGGGGANPPQHGGGGFNRY